MGFFSAIGKIIIAFVLIGIVIGGAGLYFVNTQVVPAVHEASSFLSDRYDKLERFDNNPVAAHNPNTYID